MQEMADALVPALLCLVSPVALFLREALLFQFRDDRRTCLSRLPKRLAIDMESPVVE